MIYFKAKDGFLLVFIFIEFHSANCYHQQSPFLLRNSLFLYKTFKLLIECFLQLKFPSTEFPCYKLICLWDSKLLVIVHILHEFNYKDFIWCAERESKIARIVLHMKNVGAFFDRKVKGDIQSINLSEPGVCFPYLA